MQSGSTLSPLCVPVELARAGRRSDDEASQLRWYRLGIGISAEAIRLRSAVPDELRDGPLRVRLHLPPPTAAAASLAGSDWDSELVLTAEAAEEVVDAGSERERAEPRLLALLALDPLDRQRIEDYVALRLTEDA